MPEGPEVWILSKAINNYLDKNKNANTNIEYVKSYGKHLIIYYKDKSIIDWSFGLTGKVYIDDNCRLEKLFNSFVPGGFKIISNDYYESQNSISWMSYSINNETLKNIIDKWKLSKTKLGNLLLNQDEISGIGVAWGSEILYRANLNPDIKACEQNLDNLSDIIIDIKNEIKPIYNNYLNENENDLKFFINEWFDNLYKIRKMDIYKKGKPLNISGRKWWIKY